MQWIDTKFRPGIKNRKHEEIVSQLSEHNATSLDALAYC